MDDVIVVALEAVDSPDQAGTSKLEILKEVNESIRHWEVLLFASAEKFFTVVAICIGAAGAVVAWSDVTFQTKQYVITLFLGMAVVVSISALVVIRSTKAYLAGFYSRRRQLKENDENLAMRADPEKSAGNIDVVKKEGRTIRAISFCFVFAIVLCPILIAVAWRTEPRRSVLAGARLQGADLSVVAGLTQHDLDEACGDARTKIPVNLVLKYCEAGSTNEKAQALPTANPGEPAKK